MKIKRFSPGRKDGRDSLLKSKYAKSMDIGSFETRFFEVMFPWDYPLHDLCLGPNELVILAQIEGRKRSSFPKLIWDGAAQEAHRKEKRATALEKKRLDKHRQ